mmetsp:Transcript_26423/g.69431  ORF Transcript_26423/g.69431 Transcript_26423/m.69431 type:complete len:593 (-) Transcript_26423:695-2473(-)
MGLSHRPAHLLQVRQPQGVRQADERPCGQGGRTRSLAPLPRPPRQPLSRALYPHPRHQGPGRVPAGALCGGGAQLRGGGRHPHPHVEAAAAQRHAPHEPGAVPDDVLRRPRRGALAGRPHRIRAQDLRRDGGLRVAARGGLQPHHRPVQEADQKLPHAHRPVPLRAHAGVQRGQGQPQGQGRRHVLHRVAGRPAAGQDGGAASPAARLAPHHAGGARVPVAARVPAQPRVLDQLGARGHRLPGRRLLPQHGQRHHDAAARQGAARAVPGGGVAAHDGVRRRAELRAGGGQGVGRRRAASAAPGALQPGGRGRERRAHRHARRADRELLGPHGPLRAGPLPAPLRPLPPPRLAPGRRGRGGVVAGGVPVLQRHHDAAREHQEDPRALPHPGTQPRAPHRQGADAGRGWRLHVHGVHGGRARDPHLPHLLLPDHLRAGLVALHAAHQELLRVGLRLPLQHQHEHGQLHQPRHRAVPRRPRAGEDVLPNDREGGERGGGVGAGRGGGLQASRVAGAQLPRPHRRLHPPARQPRRGPPPGGRAQGVLPDGAAQVAVQLPLLRRAAGARHAGGLGQHRPRLPDLVRGHRPGQGGGAG